MLQSLSPNNQPTKLSDAAEWDEVWVALGRPGGSCASKAEESLKAVVSLLAFRAEVAAALDAITPEADWTEITLAVHSAMVAMGSFASPLDESLIGSTPGQWQLEQAKRQTLAVIRKLGLKGEE